MAGSQLLNSDEPAAARRADLARRTSVVRAANIKAE
jgi:hypothetical protein